MNPNVYHFSNGNYLIKTQIRVFKTIKLVKASDHQPPTTSGVRHRLRQPPSVFAEGDGEHQRWLAIWWKEA